MSLIEINKKGLTTTIGAETIIITICYIIIATPQNSFLEIVMKIFLAVGGFGIAILWFIITATIQKENKEILP